MPKSGKIYLMTDGHFCKIGMTSKSTSKRIKELQTGNSNEIIILHEVEVRHPRKVEATLHRRYSYCKQLNEWFNLDSETVAAFQSICKQIDDNIDLFKDSIFFKKM